MSLDYFLTVSVFTMINTILALSLNILIGYAGQVSLGHAAFFGIGAYASAVLTVKFGLDYWLALLFSILVSGLIGLLLGLPALRVKEDFLVLATIGINFVVVSVFNYVKFFGGPYGILGLPRPKLFGIVFNTKIYALYVLIWTTVVFFLVRYISNTYLKLGFDTLRENEDAAESVGVSSARYKMYAFAMAGLMAGLAGNLWAHYMTVVFPDNFSFPVSIGILTMVVVGGVGTLFGPVVGAVLITFLPELLRFARDYRMLIYGFIIVFTMFFMPKGIVGSMKERIFGETPLGRKYIEKVRRVTGS
ncbi:branched-chain amino acid ABC transporter permease [Pseudothermotoga sp.]|nr:branched-chain amino acid ABC transporter permease [Pseudothermotoga sp.]MCX7812853.1 branched-chain amino acid ABC transporter permease [Pseudothermotoga sp.]MDW8140264.1 branched-chain amino acid ABC transporter permease [Pseudothermotoga sp.]